MYCVTVGRILLRFGFSLVLTLTVQLVIDDFSSSSLVEVFFLRGSRLYAGCISGGGGQQDEGGQEDVAATEVLELETAATS